MALERAPCAGPNLLAPGSGIPYLSSWSIINQAPAAVPLPPAVVFVMGSIMLTGCTSIK